MVRNKFVVITLLALMAMLFASPISHAADQTFDLLKLLGKQDMGGDKKTDEASQIETMSRKTQFLVEQELGEPSIIEIEYRRRLKSQRSFPTVISWQKELAQLENWEENKKFDDNLISGFGDLADGGSASAKKAVNIGVGGTLSTGTKQSGGVAGGVMDTPENRAKYKAYLAAGNPPIDPQTFAKYSDQQGSQQASPQASPQASQQVDKTANKENTSISVVRQSIREQLKGLGDVSQQSKETKLMSERLNAQLLDIAKIEADENKEKIASLELSAKKGGDLLRLNLDLISQLKPLSVSSAISQFGYNVFNMVAGSSSAHISDGAVTTDYIIGPGDEMAISLGGSMHDKLDVAVARDGKINLFGDSPILAAGLTFGQLSSLVSRMVKEKLVGVTATVNLTKLRWMRIFVLGDVVAPGSCFVNGMSSLSNAFMMCGGAKKNGSLRSIVLIRGGKKVATLDFYNFLLRGDTSSDSNLQPGDVIMVSPIKDTVAIAGEVNRPAIYELNGKINLDELLSISGGMRPTSLMQMAQIERISPDGIMSAIDVDLSKPEKKIPLQNGDLVKIFSILEAGDGEHVIYLMGNMKRPGKRQFTKGMRVLDAIKNLEELKSGAFLDYALIERESGVVNGGDVFLRFNLGKVLNGSIEDNLELMAKDKIYVFNKGAFAESDFVQVEGAVIAPGKYEFKKGSRVIDLLLMSGGLRSNVRMEEGELYRIDPDTRTLSLFRFDLKRALALEDSQNILLQKEDRLVVHSIEKAQVSQNLEISGEVNKPGLYPYAENMTVKDLILAAGNLTDKAYKGIAELTQYEIANGENRTIRRTDIDLNAAMVGDPVANIKLKPYDRIFIRQIRDWDSGFEVELKGEVRFPGRYQIKSGDMLSGLIKRAGGFTPDAFLFGSRFTRKSVAKLQKEQFLEMADRLETDTLHYATTPSGIGVEKDAAKQQLAVTSMKTLAEKLRNTTPEGRMVVVIPDGDSLANSEFDIRLQEGDSLYVPRKPDVVLVMGAVANPNAFSFSKRKGVNDYLQMAGGYSQNADPESVFIIKSSGETKKVKGGFFHSNALNPGDVIIVPEEISRYSGLEATKDVSQVLYQLAITAASLKTVGVIK